MKTKLYKKYVKQVCKNLKHSRKQLFSKDYLRPFVVYVHKLDFVTKKFVKDKDMLEVICKPKILSSLWNTLDIRTAYLLAHWKHSHWKPYVQMHLDLGEKLEDVVEGIVKARRVSL